MARFGMVIDTAKCVGCMDCVVACQTENDVPHGYCRDWITTEVRGAFPTVALEIRSERCNHCDNPQGVHRVVPVRRALRAPEGLHRQVHVLPAPDEGGQGPGVRVGLPDALHVL